MLYKRTVTEEYFYESEGERTAHVASKVSEGFVDSGQLKERICPATLIAIAPLPVWENDPSDYKWYARLTKVETADMETKLEPETTRPTNSFSLDELGCQGLPIGESSLRRLHDLALKCAGDSAPTRALLNRYYLEVLAVLER